MTVYDWSKVSRETLERLTESVHTSHAADVASDKYLQERLVQARAEALVPPLRTRAEVDAEIVGIIRDYHQHATRPGWKEFADWDCLSTGPKDALNRLCSEPIAPEPSDPIGVSPMYLNQNAGGPSDLEQQKAQAIMEPTRAELNETSFRVAAMRWRDRQDGSKPFVCPVCTKEHLVGQC